MGGRAQLDELVLQSALNQQGGKTRRDAPFDELSLLRRLDLVRAHPPLEPAHVLLFALAERPLRRAVLLLALLQHSVSATHAEGRRTSELAAALDCDTDARLPLRFDGASSYAAASSSASIRSPDRVEGRAVISADSSGSSSEPAALPCVGLGMRGAGAASNGARDVLA